MHQFPVDIALYFHNHGNMETKDIIPKLTALAHENRLGIFRLLVVAGTGGMPAGKIAEQLALPGATASFHLKELHRAGLLLSRHEGRFIYYSANYTAMNDLLTFLTDNCCGGAPCELSNPSIPGVGLSRESAPTKTCC